VVISRSEKHSVFTDEFARWSGEGGDGERRIGILTGGGDVPGLNSVIKSVTYRSTENDIEVFGLRQGWRGSRANIDDPNSKSTTLSP
jgi:hypothetical protein